jgi:hypothetical protein
MIKITNLQVWKKKVRLSSATQVNVYKLHGVTFQRTDIFTVNALIISIPIPG